MDILQYPAVSEDDPLDIVIRPIVEIPRTQVWFWSKGWQDQLAQSKKDIEKGKAKVFKSVKEARKHFDD